MTSESNIYTDYAVDKDGNIFRPENKARCFVLTNLENGEKIGVFRFAALKDFLYADTKQNHRTPIYDCAKRRQNRITPTVRIPFSTVVDYGTDEDREFVDWKSFQLLNDKYTKYLTERLLNERELPKGKKRCTGPCKEVKELKDFACRGKAAKCKKCHNEKYNLPQLTIEDVAKGAYVWP